MMREVRCRDEPVDLSGEFRVAGQQRGHEAGQLGVTQGFDSYIRPHTGGGWLL